MFETGFSNLQFMAMAAMADRADHHLFEKTLASIQTDEARHAQIGHPVLRTLLENGSRERAQYLVDKMWWRCWRLFLALTGTAMEYLTPLDARTRSFKEFMEEWVTEQFMKNLAEFDLERPWFWDLFVEELDYAHHSFQLGLYTYRTTLWFDVAMPDDAEREWLNAKYPDWEDDLRTAVGSARATAGRHGGESSTLAYALPALCNLCQLPTLFVRPGRNTACTLEIDGRQLSVLLRAVPLDLRAKRVPRFADHKSVVDRIVVGEAPGKLTDLHEWMGLRGARRDRQGPAAWPRSVAPRAHPDGAGARRCGSICSATERRLLRRGHRDAQRTHRRRNWLISWSPGDRHPSGSGRLTVRNESGDLLDPDSTIAAADWATVTSSPSSRGVTAQWTAGWTPATLDDVWEGEMLRSDAWVPSTSCCATSTARCSPIRTGALIWPTRCRRANSGTTSSPALPTSGRSTHGPDNGVNPADRVPPPLSGASRRRPILVDLGQVR